VELRQLVGEADGVEHHDPGGAGLQPQRPGGFGGHGAAGEFLVVPRRAVRAGVGIVPAGLDRVPTQARDDPRLMAQPVQFRQQPGALGIAGGDHLFVLDQRVDHRADRRSYRVNRRVNRRVSGWIDGVVWGVSGCGI